MRNIRDTQKFKKFVIDENLYKKILAIMIENSKKSIMIAIIFLNIFLVDCITKEK